MVDPVRIAQVLSNLLNNALKYTDPGGDIRLNVQPVKDALRFEVSDNGIGLSASALDKLFVMFSQEQASLERSEGGLGIGLALAKALVELHGGTVSASSPGPGMGSTFVVELPWHAEVQPPSSGSAALAPADLRQALPATHRVLLADDNQDACEVLAEVLRLSGHAVVTAHDGTQAALLALQQRPDVLVLDIGMPGTNGYEVARQVRAQPWGGQPLLVAATGWGQEEDRRKATEVGFDVHLTKPFDPVVLVDLLAQRPSQAPRPGS